MRELDNADGGLREDCEEDLADVGCNTDIYVVNQENTGSTYEVHVGGCSVCFQFQWVKVKVKSRFISYSYSLASA